MLIGGGGRGLLIEPIIATIAKKASPSTLIPWSGARDLTSKERAFLSSLQNLWSVLGLGGAIDVVA